MQFRKITNVRSATDQNAWVIFFVTVSTFKYGHESYGQRGFKNLCGHFLVNIKTTKTYKGWCDEQGKNAYVGDESYDKYNCHVDTWSYVNITGHYIIYKIH